MLKLEGNCSLEQLLVSWVRQIFGIFVLSLTCVVFGWTSANTTEIEQPEIIHTTDPDFLKTLQNVSEFNIAVLPMENLTVEGDIAYHFRNRLMERLRVKGFTVIESQVLDSKLYELGLRHAGQLRLVSFEKLQELTAADAFLSGVVEQGAVQHAGVYNSYVFSCSLKLQNRDGLVFWVSLQNRVAKRRFAIDPVNIFLDIFLTESGGNMQDAIYALADEMLLSLPDGPVKIVTHGDALLDMAIETRAKGN